MILKALIVEQLEDDGTLRTLRLQAANEQHLLVAFAREYDEPTDGPFHFLDAEDERRFREGFANCRARRLSSEKFFKSGDTYHVKSLAWTGIPTERGCLSYYALSLPKLAVPQRIAIIDPRRPDREYRRTVRRDEARSRYVIYLECSSSFDRFDFELACEFKLDREDRFSSSEYEDQNTRHDGSLGHDWEYWLSNTDRNKVQQFLSRGPL